MFKLGVQVLKCDKNITQYFYQSFVRHAAGFSGYNKPKHAGSSDRKFQRDDRSHRSSRPHQDHTQEEEYSNKQHMGQANDKRMGQRRYDFYNKQPHHSHNHDNRYKSSNNQRNADKYKDVRTPNLLTWSDKQQIRMLNEQSPEQWTPDRLAGTFPATVFAIKKILSNRWQPTDIDKHDAAVLKHWQQFQSGQYKDLEPALALHLTKFLPSNQIKEPAEEQLVVCAEAPEQELAKKEEEPWVEQDRNSYSVIQDIHQASHKSEVPVIKSHSNKSVVKYKTKKVTIKEEKPEYPEKITIPKDKWKQGATYKVGDAYYHSDGHFMYRVPGMTD